jgi:TP901 family phage tail tape measure protein
LVAVGAAGAGIYKLATFSAQLGGEIYDLSQKVNFTAETLSSLKVAAELSGGSLQSLSTSLGIFDRNMEEAREGGNEMSRVFQRLKIDTIDNEKALRQAFTALAAMSGGAQQTALAMKLFGRSGKEVLGIVKETGGNVDDFIEKMRAMGLVVTASGAKKADEFGDKLTMVRNKLEAVARQIGSELIPTVEQAADDVSKWLKENQGEILKTAKEIGSLVSEIYGLAKTIQSLSPLILEIQIIKKISEVVSGLSASGVGAMPTNIFGAAGPGASANAPSQHAGLRGQDEAA